MVYQRGNTIQYPASNQLIPALSPGSHSINPTHFYGRWELYASMLDGIGFNPPLGLGVWISICVSMVCMVVYFNWTWYCLRSLLKILAKVSYQRVNTHVWMNQVQSLKEALRDVPRVRQCRQVKLLLLIQWDQGELQIGHDLVIQMMDTQGILIILYPSYWSNLLCPWLACASETVC